jgi:hypothetical protein
MFRRLIHAQPDGEKAITPASEPLATPLRAQMPWTLLLLKDASESLVEEFLEIAGDELDQPDITQRFASFLRQRMTAGTLEIPYLPEVLRYELGCLANSSAAGSVDDYERILYRGIPLRDNGVDLSAAMKPYLFSHIQMDSFEYDIEQLIEFLRRGEAPPALPKMRSVIVFHPVAGGRNFKVSSASADLMPMLDGANSIAAIDATLASRYGLTSAEDKEQLLGKVQGFLHELLITGIIGIKV